MNLFYRLSQLVKDYQRSSVWKRIFSVTACMVVFFTTYALILPALTLEPELICTSVEHSHTAQCVTVSKELICEIEEAPGHTHSSDCYQTNSNLVCGQEEAPATEESEGHTHSGSCYEEEKVLVCGESECEGHSHGDGCYSSVEEITCGMEEHKHDENCYAEEEMNPAEEETEEAETEEELLTGDPDADVENRTQWEATMKKVKLTGVWADDLLAIARSQEGYKESTANFIQTPDGKINGYSRYGAWYGNAYGDWCAMYVSFCLNYAGIPSEYVPYNAECSKWITDLKELKLFRKSGSDYQPKPGDLIFFDFSHVKSSDHVGIVTDVEGGKVYTIEGNSSDEVRTRKYELGDASIVGYGELPENPELAAEEETEAPEETEETEETEAPEVATEFVYEDDELVVTVTVPEEAAMSAEASFEVEKLEADSKAAETADQLLQEYAEEQGVTILDYILYDMHFQENDEEVEPGAAVNVKLEFTRALELLGGVGEDEEIRILHMNEQAEQTVVEDVTEDVSLDAKNRVEEASFVTESFSTVTIAKTSTNGNKNNIKAGTARSVEDMLGNAVCYGIVANKLRVSSHMDTTFAVKNLNFATNNVTAGAYTDSTNANNAGWYWISRITNGTFNYDTANNKKGTTYVGTNSEDKVKTDGTMVNNTTVVKSESEIDAYVDGLIDSVHAMSDAMAAEKTYTPVPPNNESRDNYYANFTNPVDIRGLGAGTYYLDGDYFFGRDNYKSPMTNTLKIAMDADQVIVFNFQDKAVTVGQYRVIIGGKEYDAGNDTAIIEPVPQHVIFNMPNCTDLIVDNTCGTFIAPHAKLSDTFSGSCAGWIVADEIDGNSGEWHFIYQHMPKDVPSVVKFTIEGTKTVNGVDPAGNEKFTFILEEKKSGGWTKLDEKQNNGSKIEFDPIEFNKDNAGTHWYRVKEVDDSREGYTFSTVMYIVKVISDASGKVTEQTVYDADDVKTVHNKDVPVKNNVEVPDAAKNIAFNNTKSVKALVEAYKQIRENGTLRDPSTLKGESFEFVMKEALLENGKITVKPEGKTYTAATNANDYKATFPEITYSGETAKYYYIITETDPGKDKRIAGMSYDDSERYVMVEVKAGSIVQVSNVDETGAATNVNFHGSSVNGPVFYNSYVEPTDITVNKKWFDASGTEITNIQGGSITFDLIQTASKSTVKPSETVAFSIKEEAYNFNANGWPNGDWKRNSVTNITSEGDGTAIPSAIPKGSKVVITFKFNNFHDWYGTGDGWTNANPGNSVSVNGSVKASGIKDTKTHTVTITTNAQSDISIVFKNYDDGNPQVGSLDVTITPPAAQQGDPEVTTKTYGPFTISNADGWTWSSSKAIDEVLPKTGVDKNGNPITYTYTVQEKLIENVNTSYEQNGNTITIINRKTADETYSLPETGGPGTRTIRMLGIMMASIAAGLMIFKKRRKEGI